MPPSPDTPLTSLSSTTSGVSAASAAVPQPPQLPAVPQQQPQASMVLGFTAARPSLLPPSSAASAPLPSFASSAMIVPTSHTSIAAPMPVQSLGLVPSTLPLAAPPALVPSTLPLAANGGGGGGGDALSSTSSSFPPRAPIVLAGAAPRSRIVVPEGAARVVPRASAVNQRVVMMSGTMLPAKNDDVDAFSESDSDDDPWTGSGSVDKWSVKQRSSV